MQAFFTRSLFCAVRKLVNYNTQAEIMTTLKNGDYLMQSYIWVSAD